MHEAVQRAERVKAFLRDDIVQEAFAALEKRYYEQFKAAIVPDTQRQAWALSRALDDLRAELQVVVDAGERASIEQQQRDARESRKRRTV
jgi:hypothetical protein